MFLKYEDRKKIEIMINNGFKVVNIASLIGVSRQTVYRELGRCEKNNYSADEAQKTLRK